MDEEFPRSKRTNETAFVQFLNLSTKTVEIIWSNFDGIGIPYVEIKPRHCSNINTYVHHYWIALDNTTRERMNFFAGPSRYPSTIFTPIKTGKSDGKRKLVLITLPIFSLKELCFQRLRTHRMDEQKMRSIDLPRFLKDEFITFLENPNELRLSVENRRKG